MTQSITVHPDIPKEHNLNTLRYNETKLIKPLKSVKD